MQKTEFKDKVKPYLERFADTIYDVYYPEKEWQRKSWIASDLGRCPTGVYYAREGKLEPDAIPQFAKNVMHEGRMKELEIIIKLIVEGVPIISTQERLFNQTLDISGRYDVLYQNQENNRPVVEEIKTVNSRSFWYRAIKDENNETIGISAQPEHILQITFYLHELLLQYPTIYGILRYRSRDDGTEFKVPVFYNENVWNEIESILNVLNDAWKNSKPPKPVDDVVQDDTKRKWVVNWKARFCDYHKHCTGNPNWLKEATEKVTKLNKQL